MDSKAGHTVMAELTPPEAEAEVHSNVEHPEWQAPSLKTCLKASQRNFGPPSL